MPPQLKLCEVSDELRRLLFFYISLEIGRVTHVPMYDAVFRENWRRVAMDLHVLFLKKPINNFDHDPNLTVNILNNIIQHSNFGKVFDLVEFLVRHPGISSELKSELAGAFITACAALEQPLARFTAKQATRKECAMRS